MEPAAEHCGDIRRRLTTAGAFVLCGGAGGGGSDSGCLDRKEYTFVVHAEANKHQIRAVLLELFGVTATSVRTMLMRRDEVVRGRTRGTTARWKKAVVTLKEGESLPVFEG